MVLASCDSYKINDRAIAVFLSVDHVGGQCNRLAIGKLLKGNKVSSQIAPGAQQNDEP